MTNSDPFKSYLEDLQNKLSTGDTTERTHYSTLEALLKAMEEDIVVINEPKRIECGAPDFIINRSSKKMPNWKQAEKGRLLPSASNVVCAAGRV